MVVRLFVKLSFILMISEFTCWGICDISPFRYNFFPVILILSLLVFPSIYTCVKYKKYFKRYFERDWE